MSIRDQLRQKAFQKKGRKRVKFTYNGSDYEVLSPNVGDIMAIEKIAGKSEIEQNIWMIIYLTVAPDTDERVFEDTDFKLFLDQTLDGIIPAAAPAIQEVFASSTSAGK